MNSFLIDDSSEHKNAKGLNKNVVATISLMNTKMVCWMINVWDFWSKTKNHGIRAYEINKIYLSWFDDKIYILNIDYNGLTSGYEI